MLYRFDIESNAREKPSFIPSLRFESFNRFQMQKNLTSAGGGLVAGGTTLRPFIKRKLSSNLSDLGSSKLLSFGKLYRSVKYIMYRNCVTCNLDKYTNSYERMYN